MAQKDTPILELIRHSLTTGSSFSTDFNLASCIFSYLSTVHIVSLSLRTKSA